MLGVEYVRVKDKTTGHKFSWPASAAEAAEAAGEVQILKQDAVDHNDLPLPPEYADPAPTSGQKATDNTSKES